MPTACGAVQSSVAQCVARYRLRRRSTSRSLISRVAPSVASLLRPAVHGLLFRAQQASLSPRVAATSGLRAPRLGPRYGCVPVVPIRVVLKSGAILLFCGIPLCLACGDPPIADCGTARRPLNADRGGGLARNVSPSRPVLPSTRTATRFSSVNPSRLRSRRRARSFLCCATRNACAGSSPSSQTSYLMQRMARRARSRRIVETFSARDVSTRCVAARRAQRRSACSSCALFIRERPFTARCLASLRSCANVRPPAP